MFPNFIVKPTSNFSSLFRSFSFFVKSSWAFFLRSFFLLRNPRRYSLKFQKPIITLNFKTRPAELQTALNKIFYQELFDRCKLRLFEKHNTKLQTCENFHQKRELSFLSLASSWPPYWITTDLDYRRPKKHWLPGSWAKRAGKSN